VRLWEAEIIVFTTEKGGSPGGTVIPRSSKNEIAEILNDSTVKIRLTDLRMM